MGFRFLASVAFGLIYHLAIGIYYFGGKDLIVIIFNHGFKVLLNLILWEFIAFLD